MKPVCKYDPDCYQRNPEHRNKYAHPKRDAINAAKLAATTTTPAPAPVPVAVPVAATVPADSHIVDLTVDDDDTGIFIIEKKADDGPKAPAPVPLPVPVPSVQPGPVTPAKPQPVSVAVPPSPAIVKPSPSKLNVVLVSKTTSQIGGSGMAGGSSASPNKRKRSLTQSEDTDSMESAVKRLLSAVPPTRPDAHHTINIEDYRSMTPTIQSSAPAEWQRRLLPLTQEMANRVLREVYEMPYGGAVGAAAKNTTTNNNTVFKLYCVAVELAAARDAELKTSGEGDAPTTVDWPCKYCPLTNSLPGWELVGPFAVLHTLNKALIAVTTGSANTSNATKITLFTSETQKWSNNRFKYDPPELQTIAISGATDPVTGHIIAPQRHLAFHRDDPKALPTMTVLGDCGKTNKFSIEGSYNAGDVCWILAENMDPVAGFESAKKLAAKTKLLDEHTNGDGVQVKKGGATTMSNPRTVATRNRNRASLASTFSGLGILVPYDKKTEVGYRPMLLSKSRLAQILKQINNTPSSATTTGTASQQQQQTAIPAKAQEELDEQFQFADIANDECDFGLNLELGLNVFAMISKKNMLVYHSHRILDVAYSLLGRDLYAHILRIHFASMFAGKK